MEGGKQPGIKFELPLSPNSWTLFDACIWCKLDSGLETFKLMFSYVRLLVVCMSSNTDHCDAICLDLLSKLLYPRGLGKKAVFIKHFKVCVITTSLFMVMIALFQGFIASSI